MIEIVHLLLISIHMSPSILCKVVELIHIFHHSHVSLLQLQKLGQLPIQQTNKNIVLTESSSKLSPSHMVVYRLHGIKNVPPSTGRSLKLLCGKAHLLLTSHIEQLNILLQNTKLMLYV